jgi:uncharacterized membrane protein YgcG
MNGLTTGKKNSVKIILITKNVVNRLHHTVMKNTPPGQLCRDEIDDCTDESGCGQNPIVPEPILDCFDDNGRWVPCEDEPPVDDPCVENPGGLGCPRIPEDPVEPKDPIVYDDGEVEEEEEDDNEDSSGGSDSNGNSGSGGAGNGGDGSNGDGDNGGNGDSNNNGEVFE